MNTHTAEVDVPVSISESVTTIVRLFGWMMLAVMLVYVINNFLNYGAGLPGAAVALQDQSSTASLIQLALYPLVLVFAFLYVRRNSDNTLRQDSAIISNFNTVFIRCAFWVVLFVGVGDAIVSFMRVEGMLEGVLGEEIAKGLGRPEFRGLNLHLPLLFVGVLFGLFTRTLGFTWLAILIVLAELMIVISRFVFSYEQAFMADLVRFWYGALFLFASAYTLLEEGHVRVDVFYAGMKSRTKGLVNAIGSIVLGITLCWTILIVGMSGEFALINAPIFSFEVTQSSFGMYVKYMMAGFLGVFAISMMIQFVSYFMEAVADFRGEPGKREVAPPGTH